MRSSRNLSQFPNQSRRSMINHLNKTKSYNLQNKQPITYTKHKSEQERLQLNHEQIQLDVSEIKQFIHDFAMDPHFLLSLVDYKQLIDTERRQQLEILQKINLRKQQYEQMKNMISDTSNQSYQKKLGLIQNDYVEVEKQLKKYQHLLQQQKKEHNLKMQMQTIKVQILRKNIKEIKQKQKKQIQRLLLQQKQKQNRKSILLNKISKAEAKIQQVNDKKIYIKDKKCKIKQLQKEWKLKQKQIKQLKQNQSHMISKNNNLMKQSKKQQAQLKHNCQKKLNKFIKQLTKIIEKSDNKTFQQFALTHEKNYLKIRSKNLSQATMPDQNDENSSEQRMSGSRQFQGLQISNPIFKQYQNLQLKRLEETISKQKYSHFKHQNIQEQELKFKHSSNQADSKLQKLSEQQKDLEGLLDCLKEKIGKINSQISNSKKAIHVFN